MSDPLGRLLAQHGYGGAATVPPPARRVSDPLDALFAQHGGDGQTGDIDLRTPEDKAALAKAQQPESVGDRILSGLKSAGETVGGFVKGMVEPFVDIASTPLAGETQKDASGHYNAAQEGFAGKLGINLSNPTAEQRRLMHLDDQGQTPRHLAASAVNAAAQVALPGPIAKGARLVAPVLAPVADKLAGNALGRIASRAIAGAAEGTVFGGTASAAGGAVRDLQSGEDRLDAIIEDAKEGAKGGALAGGVLGGGLKALGEGAQVVAEGRSINKEAAKPVDVEGVKQSFLDQLTPEEQAYAKASPEYRQLFDEPPQQGPSMSVAGETGQIRRRLGKPQKPIIEPGPDAQTYSTKSTKVLRRPGGAKPIEEVVPAEVAPEVAPTPEQPIVGPERPLGTYSTPEPDANRLQPVATASPDKALVRPDAQRRANKLIAPNSLPMAEAVPPLRVGAITEEQAGAINAGHRLIRNAPAGEVVATPEAVAHIWENPGRRAQMEKLGYTSAEHFMQDVGQGFTHIYDTGPNSIGLARHTPDGRVVWANLTEDANPQWVVGSGAPFREGKFNQKTQLWPPAPVATSTLPDQALSPAANPTQALEGSGPAEAARLTETQSRPRNLPSGEPTGNIESPAPPSDILNVAKLDLDSKTAEQRVAAQLEQFRQLRESNKQTFNEADINRAEIVKELVSGDGKALDPTAAKKLSGEELLARRDVVRQNDQIIDEMSKKIESRTLSVAEHEKAVGLLQKAIEQNDALLSDLVTGSSQKGRDLNLLRRMANRSLDPDVWLVQAKRMLGDKPLTDEISTSIRKLAKEAADACGGA